MASPVVIDLTGPDETSQVGTERTPLQNINNRPIAKKTPTPKKKPVAAKTKGHVLIWHPYYGTEGGKGLKIMGVYDTKEKALAAREVVMSRY
jgi:hypothetical protein